MKTITKFIFGFPMLALACGSIAFAVELLVETALDTSLEAAFAQFLARQRKIRMR